MAECLTDLEAGRSDKMPVEKCLNGKLIKVGANRVGYTFKGEWKWTVWALERYSAETREMAKACAESD
eukprot:4741490-Pyramimonas_sp.AAC.1